MGNILNVTCYINRIKFFKKLQVYDDNSNIDN